MFQFKQKSQDFIVYENLPFTLSGKGDAFYVNFEKVNMTTHQVITHLRRKFNISRLTLGIAGLKDKKAVARQRISIYKKALNQLGGVKAFLAALEEKVTIVETGWHDVPLNLSTPITNTFHIKFRSMQAVSQTDKDRVRRHLEEVLSGGYANLFGDQRFGINARNATQGREILSGKSKERFNKTDMIFKIQAYASHVFNEYVQERQKQGDRHRDGDIVTRTDGAKQIFGLLDVAKSVVHVCPVRHKGGDFFFTPEPHGKAVAFDPTTMMSTGPVIGFNLAVPESSTKAGVFEKKFLERRQCTSNHLEKMQHIPIYGLRRQLRVTPTNPVVSFRQGDLLVTFTLPSGSYASIVFEKLQEVLK